MWEKSSREATPTTEAPEESPRPAQPYVSEGEDSEEEDMTDMDDDDIV